ncbi:MAG TPA: lipid-binding SYLF domain-containing protein [Candidatus Acidoferrum sp.]|nr:lipid-binding SYLF domain-containing protein [Candidatus Acidoferrum sp.]
MRKVCVSLLAGVFLAFTGSSLLAADDTKETDRVQNAGQVMTEILNVPDDIPQDILNKAYCVVVLPSVLKAAFIVGASYGRGVMTCRSGPKFDGLWGAPTMMALEGGSVGFQIGGEATDFVLLLMSDRSAKGILTSKVKLGADASAAAGPKGRTASAATDATMRAEILSYSRARGAFAGVSLEGSTLRPDNDANTKLYGKEVNAEAIVLKGAVKAPPSAKLLLRTLDHKSPHRKA